MLKIESWKEIKENYGIVQRIVMILYFIILIYSLINLWTFFAYSQDAIPPDSEVGGDTNLSKVEIPLNQGIWNPDGIAIDNRVDFSDITNFRPIDNGLKAVDGYQRINTTAVPSYPYLKSLYQYTSDGITDYSMILAQADDGSGNSVVIQNNSTVPYTGTDAPFVSYAELITTNAGFETTGGWTGGTITNTQYHNGAQSMQLAPGGSPASVETADTSYFTINANVMYTLKLWVLSASSDFDIFIRSAANTMNMALYYPDFDNYTSNKWSYVELSFISSIALTDAKVEFAGAAGTTFYFDDVSVKADYLLTATTSLKGSFSKGPKESILYSNGYQNYIWPGQEFEPAVVFTAANDVDTTMTNQRDWTDAILDESDGPFNVAYVGFVDQSDMTNELLVHLDTDYTDSSTNGFSITSGALRGISTTTYKFGGGSAYATVATDYLTVPDDAAWAMPNAYYEFDQWVYTGTTIKDGIYYIQSDGTNYIKMYFDHSTRKLKFEVESSGGGGLEEDLSSSEWFPEPYTWYHVYFAKWNSRIYFFINGEYLGYGTLNAAIPNIGGTLKIGGHAGGRIDEVHISQGTDASSVFTDDFNPNEMPYDFGNSEYLLIGSHYPFQGVKIYVPYDYDTYNKLSEVSITGEGGWVDIQNVSDNSNRMFDNGWITIPTYIVPEFKKKTINDLTLYWMKIEVPVVSRQISAIRLYSQFQEIPNNWDREYEVSAEAKVWKNSANTFYDYSDQVNSEVTTDVMDLSGLTSSDYVKVSFAHRVSGIKIYMPDDNINTTAATTLTVYGWSGSAWQKVKNQSDGTSSNSVSLAKTGIITFEGFPKPQEHMYADDYGQLFYQYKLVWDKTLSTSVKPYYIEGIPYVEDPPSSKFPLSFNNRAVLANLSDGPADILISANNAPFIYNGRDSARYRIGGEDELVSGVSMTVKYESGNYDIMLLHKKNETWQVQGISPDNFKISRLSDKTGCIAPATIDTMQIADGNHIAMWLSSSGVVMSDGTNITRIPGLEQYFDKTKPNLLINYTYATKAIGFFDYDNLEYNLQMPYGASTSNNVWLVYSLKKQKWFKKDPPQYFESATGVRDSYGGKYVYGGTSDGYLLRNEYSGTWFGTEATCKACAVKSSVTLNELELGSMWNEGTIKHMRIRGKNLPKKMNYDDDIATAYTEVDASGKLTKTQATDLTFSFTDAGGSAKAYAYTNTGSTFLNANWEEWAYTTEINLSSVTTSDAAYVFGLCEANTDDFETVVDVSNKAGYGVKMVGTAAGVYRLEFEHWTGGAESQTGTNTITGLAQGTTYFVTIVKTKDYGYNDSTKKQYRLLGYVHTDKELRNEIGSVSTYINSSNDVDTDLPYLYYFSAASVASIGTVKNTAEIDYLAAFIRKDGFYNWADIKFFGSQYDSESDYSVPKYEDIVRRIESRKANTSQIQLTVNRKWTDGKPPELYKIGLLYDLDRVDTAITPEF